MSKKTCILDTTLSLIKDYGFHGTSMSMIANKAGAATGTIYHHYASKDDLIKDLFRYVNEQLAAATVLSNDSETTFKESFFSLWKSQYHFYVAHPEALIFLEHYMSSPYFIAEEQEYLDEIYKYLRDFFQSGMDMGNIKRMNKEILTPVIRGSITTTAKLHLASNHNFNEEDLDKVADLVWSGIKI